MSKEIKSVEEINFNKTYQIEVVLPEQFQGSFDPEQRTFTKCLPESKVTDSIDFSFDLDEEEEYEGYDDIPEENMVVINQSDIDNGIIIVRELSL